MPTISACGTPKGLLSPADFSHPPHRRLPRRICSDNILCKQQPSLASIPINRQAAESNPHTCRSGSAAQRTRSAVDGDTGSSWRMLLACRHGFLVKALRSASLLLTPRAKLVTLPCVPQPLSLHTAPTPTLWEASCDGRTSPQPRGRSSGSLTRLAPQLSAQRPRSPVLAPPSPPG